MMFFAKKLVVNKYYLQYFFLLFPKIVTAVISFCILFSLFLNFALEMVCSMEELYSNKGCILIFNCGDKTRI